MASNYPPPPDTKGNKGEMTFPNGKVLHHTVEDEVKYVSPSWRNCCLYIQKLRFRETDGVELRFCYYIIGHKPRSQGKWVWGQFAPSFPKADFNALIAKAKAKGLL